jgi:hypothetical protein
MAWEIISSLIAFKKRLLFYYFCELMNSADLDPHHLGSWIGISIKVKSRKLETYWVQIWEKGVVGSGSASVGSGSWSASEWNIGSGSASKWKAESGSAWKWCGSATLWMNVAYV